MATRSSPNSEDPPTDRSPTCTWPCHNRQPSKVIEDNTPPRMTETLNGSVVNVEEPALRLSEVLHTHPPAAALRESAAFVAAAHAAFSKCSPH